MASAGLDNLDKRGVFAAGKEQKRLVRCIGVVLFEGFSLLSAGLIPEVFQMANEISAAKLKGAALYEVRLYSSKGGGVACSSSISVWTYECGAENASGFDALFIAGGEGAKIAARDERVISWLREVLPRSEVVKPIGEGRMLLQTAGVDSLGQSRVHANLPQQRVASAGKDTYDADDRYEPAKTALMLVKRDLGIDVAREIAGRLSLSGATTLLSDVGTVTPVAKVRAAARWLQENCERPISVSDAVRVVAMSERNFLRCFKHEMGVTPSEFLLQARLEMTSRLLVETNFPIDKIAKRCGWVNGDRLAKIFRKRMVLTPSEYRMRSRGQLQDEPL